jgi:hypothetical protein
MMIYSPEGIRSIDASAVLHVYRAEPDGSLYINATLCLRSGEDVSGRVLIAALDALDARQHGGARVAVAEHRLDALPATEPIFAGARCLRLFPFFCGAIFLASRRSSPSHGRLNSRRVTCGR